MVEMDSADYVTKKLKGVNDSQKWMWTAIAGLAVVTAARGTFESIIGTKFDPDKMKIVSGIPETIHYFIMGIFNSGEELGYLTVLMIIIYRFYAADQRVLEHYYINYPNALKEYDALNKKNVGYSSRFWPYVRHRLSVKKQIFDSFGRIVQYLILLFAALSLENFKLFVFLIVSLLIFNSVYNIIILIKYRPIEISEFPVGSEVDNTFKNARERWTFINLVTAMFIALLFADLPFEIYNPSAVALMFLFANSIFDLGSTIRVYIPAYQRFEPNRLQSNHDELHKKRDKKLWKFHK